MSRLAAAYGRLSASSFFASKLCSYRIVVLPAFLQAKKKTLNFKVFF
jgi:hypothetical protein